MSDVSRIASGKSIEESPQTRLERAFERLTRLIELVIGYAFMAAVGLNFVNVIDRYVFGRSILGADEIEVFIMVGMTFLSAAVVTWRRKHLRMDVVAKLLPAPVRTLLRVAEVILLACLTGVVAVESGFYSVQMFRLGVTSNTAGVEMWIPHGTVMVGAGLMVLAVVVRSLCDLRSRKTAGPLPDDGHAEPTS